MLAGIGMALLSSNAFAQWKPLPTSGFLAGRAAQVADVERGDAVFVAAVDDKVIGVPINITIPQYAYIRSSRAQVVVVQAEEANGLRMYGIRDFSGVETVALEEELELLGTSPR